jgi:hypothetical protein
MAPLLDVLMTLLHLGADGWRAALREREEVFPYLRERLAEVAAEHGARRVHAECVRHVAPWRCLTHRRRCRRARA